MQRSSTEPKNRSLSLSHYGFQHSPRIFIQGMLAFFCLLIPLQLDAENVQLHSGFNLFSYPLQQPSNLSCDQLQTLLSAERISRLDAQTQLFEACAETSSDFPIVPGEGYLIDILATDTFSFDGEFVCPLIDLHKGINLIGVPTPHDGMSCFDLLQALGDSQTVASIQQFNPLSGSYLSCTYSRLDLSGPPQGTDFTIVSGEAYVVSMVQALNDVQLNDLQQCVPAIDPPTITDFAPTSGPIGTLITLNGNNFAPTPNSILLITMAKRNGGSIVIPVSRFNNTQIQVTLPAGAITSFFTISVAQQDTTSNQLFTVESSSSFALSAEPATAQVIQGRSAAYSIKLASSNDFAQLAELSVEGLPEGISAQFEPQQITAGELSLLTLTAVEDQPLGNTAFTVTAAAVIEGISLSETIALNIETITESTGFMGRAVVGNAQQTPLAGVTITFLGRDGNGNATGCSGQTISDAAGNFSFTNLPPECTGGQLIRYEGTAVTNQPGIYADVDLFYEINEGFITESPVLINLPRIDDKETVMVIQNAPVDQIFTFATIPGLEVTFYAGTTLTKKDGSQPNPFPFIALHIPSDRLPDTMPDDPNTVEPFFAAFQPANTKASQPVSITYPNVIDTPPGTTMALMTLDPTLGIMVEYGTGTVSNNGRLIIPDLDPNHPGHRYGLVHFDWHAPAPPPPPKNNPPKPPKPPCNGKAPPLNSGNSAGGCPKRGKPVDLASGLEIITYNDLQITGSRGTIALERIFRTNSQELGPFGIGSGHRYSYQLDSTPVNIPEVVLINLVMPNGSRIPFSRTGPEIFENNSASMRGVILTIPEPQKVDIRWRGGTIYHFIRSLSTSLGSFGSVLDSIEDINGNRIQFIRNPDNDIQITTIIDPVGREITLEYDNNDRVVKATDPIGRIVIYDYASSGRLEMVTDPEGGVTRYTHPTLSDPTFKVTDARNVVIAENQYIGGQVRKQTQADGSFLSFSYLIFPPGPSFGCSGPGSCTPPPPPPPLPITTYTDAMGNETFYRRGSGKILSVEDALGRTRNIGHIGGILSGLTGTGTCLICGDTTAGDLAINYDDQGNVLTQTDGLGQTTTYTYNDLNKPTSITDAGNNTALFEYDERGNLIKATDPQEASTIFDYDDFGQLILVTDALSQETALEYDTWGNVIKITDSLGNSTVFEYDAISRLINTRDSLGWTSSTEYDKLNRVVASTDPDGNDTHFAYDPVGNLLSVTDAKNQMTTFVYDVMNRMRSRTDPLNKTESFDYDLNGNLITYTDRRGQISLFEYDVLNRLVKSTYDDGSTATQKYDAHGRLVEIDDSNAGLTVMIYDAGGQLLKMSNPLGSISYVYDVLGRVISRQVQGQPPVDYNYDPNNNLLSAVTAQGAVNFSYDKLDRRELMTRDNGVNTSYAYDALNRLTAINHQRGTTLLDAQSYLYDTVGQRISHHTDQGLSYKTQTTSRSYGPGNRLSQFDGINYTHDDNGNRLTETGPTGTTTYNWDAKNRLSSMTTADGVTTTFRYDALGNLMSKDITGSGDDFSEHYLLDDLSNVVQVSDSNGKLASVLTGRSIDSHLAVFDGVSEAEYTLRNGINSTVATVDENGAVKGQYAYEPFGETTASSTQDFSFLFTGRVPVAENIYYYRARFYDSKVGRFISEDPVGFVGGDVNLYRYVGNDPVSFIDPLGLDKLTPEQTITINAGKTAVESIANGNTVGTVVGDAATDAVGGIIKDAITDSPLFKRNTREFNDALNKAKRAIDAARRKTGFFPPSPGRGLPPKVGGGIGFQPNPSTGKPSIKCTLGINF